MTCVIMALVGIVLAIPTYAIWQMRVTSRWTHFTTRRELNEMLLSFSNRPHLWKVWEHE